MSGRRRLGWALIAGAGLVSSGIVTAEVISLVGQNEPETAETLPVIGFEPLDD